MAKRKKVKPGSIDAIMGHLQDARTSMREARLQALGVDTAEDLLDLIAHVDVRLEYGLIQLFRDR